MTSGIHIVGDVMYDAALYYGKPAAQCSTVLDRLGLMPKAYVLATVHRPRNTDIIERLQSILGAFAQVPCITLREETEWEETVQAGWNGLVGADQHKIVQMVHEFAPPSTHPDFYGSGNSADKMVEIGSQFSPQDAQWPQFTTGSQAAGHVWSKMR